MVSSLPNYDPSKQKPNYLFEGVRFTLSEFKDGSGRLWLESESGEGMEMGRDALEQILLQYFVDHF